MVNFIKMQMPQPRDEALAIFFAGEIQTELERFADGITISPNVCLDISENEWAEFIYSIRSTLGCSAPESYTVTKFLEGSDPRLIGTLKARIHEVCKKINEIVNHEFLAQRQDIFCLLPATFPARFDMLIGEGKLQLAKIDQYDLLR